MIIFILINLKVTFHKLLILFIEKSKTICVKKNESSIKLLSVLIIFLLINLNVTFHKLLILFNYAEPGEKLEFSFLIHEIIVLPIELS